MFRMDKDWGWTEYAIIAVVSVLISLPLVEALKASMDKRQAELERSCRKNGKVIYDKIGRYNGCIR